MKIQKLRQIIREEFEQIEGDSWMHNSPMEPEIFQQMADQVNHSSLTTLKANLRILVTEWRSHGIEDDQILEFITAYIQGI